MSFFKIKRLDHRFFFFVSVVGALVLFFLQIGVSLTLPFAEDEAYYLHWSKNLQWGYPEHPPMIAVFFFLANFLLGEEPYAFRFFFLAFFVLLGFVVYFLGKHLTNSAWYGLIFLFIIYFIPNFIGISLVITTDTPMVVFLFIALFFYVHAFFPNEKAKKKFPLGKEACYLLAGFFMGMALLSKLSVLLIMGFIGLYGIVSKRRREYMGNPFFYLSFVLAFVVFLPCLLWNVENDYILFKQLNYMTTQPTDWGHFRLFFQNQIFLAGPLFFFLIPFLTVRSLLHYAYPLLKNWIVFRSFYKQDHNYSSDEKSFFFAFIVFLGGCYLVLNSFSYILHPNWSFFVLICATPLVLLHISQSEKKLWYYLLGGFHLFVTLLFLIAGYFVFFLSADMVKNYPDTIGRISTFYNYEVFKGEFLNYYREKMDKELLIAGENYQIPSFVNYYWKPETQAVTVRTYSYHATIFDVLFDESKYREKDIYYIVRENSKHNPLDGLEKMCRRIEKLQTFSSKLYQEEIARFDLYRCYHFKGSAYTFPTGKPSFVSWLLF